MASLASLSLLTVTSRHIRHECTNSIIFHNSTPVARLTPAPPHQVLRFPGHGTSVTVNDLFGSMPVRVKSRYLALQRPDELEREWENLRNSLVSLLLANPQLSKLVLFDVEKGKRLSVRPAGSVISDGRISSGSREFDLKRIESIFTQSGLIIPQHLGSWHEMSASVADLTVRGAISLQPSPTRRAQFISLGKQPIQSRNSSNILYNEVNRIFALSDFGSIGTAISERSSVQNTASSFNRYDGQSDASVRSWAKPVNKWPMFYICIDTEAVILLDDDGPEHFPESEKSIQRIVDVLGAMVREFLRQHNLRPRNGKQSSSSDQFQSIDSKVSRKSGISRAPSKKDSSISITEESFGGGLKMPSFSRAQSSNATGQNFFNWSRTKTAKDLNSNSSLRQNRHSGFSPGISRSKSSVPMIPVHQPDRSNHDQELTILPGSPHNSLSAQKAGSMENPPDGSSSHKMITWVDPHTRLAYMINPRTGQTMNSRKSLAPQPSYSESNDISSESQKQNAWIDDMLDSWENPVFGRTELPIPNLGTEFVGQQTTENSSHDCFKGIGSLNAAEVAKYRGKLRRRALETAEVIAQVDKKFILVKIHTTALESNWDGTSNEILLLIDQHAADERCRIEQLFTEMFISSDITGNLKHQCGVRTVQVDCVTFEVSSTENGLFQKYQGLFSVWGIEYIIHGKVNSTVVIAVHTLPLLIAERCRLEPHVLRDLMRREIWCNEEEGRKPFQSKKPFGTEDSDPVPDISDGEDVAHQEPTKPPSRSWVQHMNGCPQGIVDLLNSRACRTAIMFNDPLNIEECQALVSRLACCAFPFQCAHGRPSMIPILDLRTVPHSVESLPLDLDTRFPSQDSEDGMDLGFTEVFRRQYPT